MHWIFWCSRRQHADPFDKILASSLLSVSLELEIYECEFSPNKNWTLQSQFIFQRFEWFAIEQGDFKLWLKRSAYTLVVNNSQMAYNKGDLFLFFLADLVARSACFFKWFWTKEETFLRQNYEPKLTPITRFLCLNALNQKTLKRFEELFCICGSDSFSNSLTSVGVELFFTTRDLIAALARTSLPPPLKFFWFDKSLQTLPADPACFVCVKFSERVYLFVKSFSLENNVIW